MKVFNLNKLFKFVSFHNVELESSLIKKGLFTLHERERGSDFTKNENPNDL